MFLPGSFAVSLRAVRKTYASGVQALDRLNLDVWPGEFLSLLGPSGCGKSTALRIIAGLSEPSGGTIEWPASAPAGAKANPNNATRELCSQLKPIIRSPL